MKQLLLIFAVVAIVGCGTTKPTPSTTLTNTLGMKFVPVMGTDVQFSIWETRVKDYAAYAAANSEVDASWEISGFTQADTHPVVNVNWEDANAFCAWLTKKEMAVGEIKAGQKYRLPTDAEWSVAVGLARETGSTPEAKNGGLRDVYPWGKEWPPPKRAGNYGGSLNVDNYEHTSPAGSFAANKLGLHDMGGNVWEWCEDWYRSGQLAPCVARCVLELLLSRRPVVVLPSQLHARWSLLQHRLSVCVGGWFRWVRLASLPYRLACPQQHLHQSRQVPPTEIHKDYLRQTCGQIWAKFRTELGQKYSPIQNNPRKWYARRDLNPQPSVPETTALSN